MVAFLYCYILYYRKLSSSTPKGYLTATDGYSNYDALIYQGVCANKPALRVYEQGDIA